MIPKPIHDITLDDLNALVGRVREGKTIEFKREMPAGTRDEVIKFLAAASSLANTGGGDLLIGVDARAGLASSILGVSFADLDAEILRLSQLLANSLEPRIPRIDIHPIPCGRNRHVIVIRTQQSWLAPHRVKLNDKFYGRNSGGKYPLDVSELRTAFVLSDSVAERIRTFRNDRLIKITGGESAVSLHENRAAMVIHVVPFSTFAGGQAIDAVEAAMKGSASRVLPLPPHPQGSEIAGVNLDGFVTLASRDDERAFAYAQLFRSGAIEGVRLLRQRDNDGRPYFIGTQFENIVVAAVKQYISFLKAIELGLPIFIFLSLCGVRGCYLRDVVQSQWYDRGPLKVDTVPLPEVSIDSDPANVPLALRPLFNTIWQGFGLPASLSYNANGDWVGTA